MRLLIALLYLAAVVLIVVAALLDRHPTPPRVSLALLGAACALLAFSIPAISAGFSGH